MDTEASLGMALSPTIAPWAPAWWCPCVQTMVMRATPLSRVKVTKPVMKRVQKKRRRGDICGLAVAGSSASAAGEADWAFSLVAPMSGSPASISASRCLSKDGMAKVV
jgi:hypothetical protein